MNLWLRLLWCILLQPFTSKLQVPSGVSTLNFRVMPHDLDAIGHMNNGRYLTMADLGRLDLVLASGLWREVVRNRWTPIASSVAIRFRREMRVFEPFRLETRLMGWDETILVIEHQFIFATGERAGQVASRALFKGGFYDRGIKAFVPVKTVMAAMGYTGASPQLPADVEAFLKADDAMRQAA
jgi:acyl-CoA thioesterase FadM